MANKPLVAHVALVILGAVLIILVIQGNESIKKIRAEIEKGFDEILTAYETAVSPATPMVGQEPGLETLRPYQSTLPSIAISSLHKN